MFLSLDLTFVFEALAPLSQWCGRQGPATELWYNPNIFSQLTLRSPLRNTDFLNLTCESGQFLSFVPPSSVMSFFIWKSEVTSPNLEFSGVVEYVGCCVKWAIDIHFLVLLFQELSFQASTPVAEAARQCLVSVFTPVPEPCHSALESRNTQNFLSHSLLGLLLADSIMILLATHRPHDCEKEVVPSQDAEGFCESSLIGLANFLN